jgi:hypothetical protein
MNTRFKQSGRLIHLKPTDLTRTGRVSELAISGRLLRERLLFMAHFDITPERVVEQFGIVLDPQAIHYSNMVSALPLNKGAKRVTLRVLTGVDYLTNHSLGTEWSFSISTSLWTPGMRDLTLRATTTFVARKKHCFAFLSSRKVPSSLIGLVRIALEGSHHSVGL